MLYFLHSTSALSILTLSICDKYLYRIVISPMKWSWFYDLCPETLLHKTYDDGGKIAMRKFLFKHTWHWRVSHNQGYHLVCNWGQKWSFLHCPKNNCTWKSIDYSVWNPNFAKLSLIFIEIYKFENPSLTRHFRVGGATQCWYDIHFYCVLLMIIFNWTY